MSEAGMEQKYIKEAFSSKPPSSMAAASRVATDITTPFRSESDEDE